MLLAAGWAVWMPVPAQEWLRWQETPLSDERDPGKRVPLPPPAKPAVQAPEQPAPLRELASAGASQPAPPIEQTRQSAVRQQAGAGSPPPSAPPQPDPVLPMRIAKAGHVASVARSQPMTAPIAAPLVGRPETAATFALPRNRQPAVAALRILDLDLRFAASRTAAPMTWSMPVAKQAPIPLSATGQHRPPLPARVPRPQIAPPATAGSPPPTRSAQTVTAALHVGDPGARLARPQTAPMALPSPASLEVRGLAAAAAPADDAALPPCVLRLRRRSAAGATGIAYLPRNEASQPCPAAVGTATLDAQRGSGTGRDAPQPAHAELLRDMLRGR